MKFDACYCRYSSHQQDGGTSIDVQIEQCERAAGGACKHYIDRAKTGRAVGGRTQLLALLADVEAKKIKRVFVYKFDRLGRSAETHMIAQQLEDAGVQLVSATEGTDALSRGIQFVVAQDYSRRLAERTRDGLRKRFEQGAWTGGLAPFGYRVGKREKMKVLEVDPAEAKVVRLMVEWYLNESIGVRSIARRLMERGIAGRRGPKWRGAAVWQVLMNPLLVGRVQFGRRCNVLNGETGRRRSQERAAGDHVKRQDESLRLIDDRTFARVQEQASAAANGQAARRGRGIQAFTGLVTCAGCGGRCYRVMDGRGRPWYRCGRGMNFKDCPNPARVREDRLAELVQTGVVDLLARADRIIAQAAKLAADSTKDGQDRARTITRDLARLDQDQQSLVRRLMDPEIPAAAKAVLSRALADTEARRSQLETALASVAEDGDTQAELQTIVRQMFDRARESLAKTLAPERFNRLVERLIGPMVIDQNGRVRWRGEMVETTAQTEDCHSAAQVRVRACAVRGIEMLIQRAFWKVAA